MEPFGTRLEPAGLYRDNGNRPVLIPLLNHPLITGSLIQLLKLLPREPFEILPVQMKL